MGDIDIEAYHHDCEIRKLIAMTRSERETFARDASVRRCRRGLNCPIACDRGNGCGRVAVMALLDEAKRRKDVQAD